MEIENRTFAYNTSYGNLTYLTNEQYKYLLKFREKYIVSKINTRLFKSLVKLKYITQYVDEDLILKNKRDKYLLPSNSSKNFKGLILRVANDCNFNCKYCIDRESVLKKRFMKLDVAIRATDLFLDFCTRYKKFASGKVSIGFNGGEPLLRLNVIKQCIEFIRGKYGISGIDFDINTNASLIDRQTALYLKSNKISVKTSLDGFQKHNDKQRQSRTYNLSAFEQTMRGLLSLKEANYTDDISLIAVITDSNINALSRSFLEFVRNDLKIKRLVLEPDILHQLSIPPRELANKIFALKKVADSLGDFVISGQWSMPFLNLVKANPHDIPNHCSSMSGLSFNIFPNGDIRFCNYLDNDYTITNVKSISRFEEIFKHKLFKNIIYYNFGGLKRECNDCQINGICKGGCFVIFANAIRKKDKNVRDYHCSFTREITDLLIKEFVKTYN